MRSLLLHSEYLANHFQPVAGDGNAAVHGRVEPKVVISGVARACAPRQMGKAGGPGGCGGFSGLGCLGLCQRTGALCRRRDDDNRLRPGHQDWPGGEIFFQKRLHEGIGVVIKKNRN